MDTMIGLRGQNGAGILPEEVAGGGVQPHVQATRVSLEAENRALHQRIEDLEDSLALARKLQESEPSGSADALRTLNQQIRALRQEATERSRALAESQVRLEVSERAAARMEQVERVLRRDLEVVREAHARQEKQLAQLQGTVEFLSRRKDSEKYGGLTPEQVESERLTMRQKIRDLAAERNALAEQVRQRGAAGPAEPTALRRESQIVRMIPPARSIWTRPVGDLLGRKSPA